MPEHALTERAGEGAPASQAPAAGGRARNVLVLLVTAALVALGAWLMDRAERPDSSAVTVSAAAEGPAPQVGRQAPAFTARTTEGERVDLGDYRGTPVWLSFVATWCSSCRAEAPDMQKVHESLGRDVVLVSVYLSEDEAAVRAYTERLGMTFTHVPDPSSTITAGYRVLAVPSHFFVDADGVLRSTHVGALSRSQMDAAIREVTGR